MQVEKSVREVYSPRALMTIRVGRFNVTFDPSALDWNVISDGTVLGVRFTYEGHYYEAFDNKYMGERLVVRGIEPGKGRFLDMPFHMGTAGFLPEGVKVSPRGIAEGALLS